MNREIKFAFQVTWIRRKDRQLLTVGRGTHSIDNRFVVVPDWSLLIKNVKHEDAGLYECQVMPIRKKSLRRYAAIKIDKSAIKSKL